MHVAELDDDDEADDEADEGVAADVELDGAAPAELATYSAAPPAARPPTATSPITPARRFDRGGDCGFRPFEISSCSGYSLTVLGPLVGRDAVDLTGVDLDPAPST